MSAVVPEGQDAIDANRRVLVVDDDASVRSLLRRVVRHEGYTCVDAASVEEALEQLDAVDVVVADLQLGDLTGIDLLQAMRKRHLDQPFILLTGRPSLESATAAVEHGAYRYLLKPFVPADLGRLLRDAVQSRAPHQTLAPPEGRGKLERSLQSALDQAWIALQPVVATSTHASIGYECLLRSRSAELPHPGVILEAAERLGSLQDLGRRIRAMATDVIEGSPDACTFYVNLHPADLADPELCDRMSPLSRVASRVILELTERSPLEGGTRLNATLASLRSLGFRIAVDDLGAGYAGLSYFTEVHPEVVKLDMSLVRGIDKDEVKRRVVQSMTELALSLGIEVVGEGVETVGERDTLASIGCTHLQGYLFARPSPPYPTARWDHV